MVNVAEEILIVLMCVLFLIAAHFFISAFVFERKLRKRMAEINVGAASRLFLPAFLISSSNLDELALRYKNKAIKSYIYLVLSLFLALGLVLSGIEILKTLDGLQSMPDAGDPV